MTLKKNQLNKDFFVTIASGIFIGAVLFDIFPETAKNLGVLRSGLFILIGVLVWWGLKTLTNYFSKQSFAIVSIMAFWAHSLLEGGITALSFSAGFTTGIIVSVGMLLHLFPEFFAITAILKGEGVSTKHSVVIDLVGVVVLLASFIVIGLELRNLSEQILLVLTAVSGGAFLYIGINSFARRVKVKVNFVGLAVGLVVVAIWNLVFLFK